jgi:lipopolysaccharide/colanic/teichoic acid biosynthesis glycosyltransferase
VSLEAQRRLKRAFDVALCAGALVALAPLAMTVCGAVLVTSGGPVLYRSVRIGKGGRLFTLYKFRTMVRGADRTGPSITHRDDPRVTSLGRLLRRTKFDEFPQVLNVLRGEMSVVGPRPESPRYLRAYSGAEARVLQVLPGLTSLAQVCFRREEDVIPGENSEDYYVTELLPKKLKLDLYYVDRWSLGLDVKVFWLGLRALFGLGGGSAKAWLEYEARNAQ